MNAETPIEKLRECGFSIVEDGGAIIVIGKRGTIPIDRPVGAIDLMRTTTARRFETAEIAADALLKPAKDPALVVLIGLGHTGVCFRLDAEVERVLERQSPMTKETERKANAHG